MKNTRKFTAVMVFTAAAFLAVPAVAGNTDPEQPPPSLQLGKIPAPPTPGAPVVKQNRAPVKSAPIEPAIRAKADRAMAASTTLKEMLAGAAYQIVREGPWTTKRSNVTLGLVREIRLSKPVDTAMKKWPALVWNESRDTYISRGFNASYKDMSMLIVYIAADRGVVALAPGPEAKVVVGPGNEWADSLKKGSN